MTIALQIARQVLEEREQLACGRSERVLMRDAPCPKCGHGFGYEFNVAEVRCTRCDLVLWAAGPPTLPAGLNKDTLRDVQQTYDAIVAADEKPTQTRVTDRCGHSRSTVRELWHFVRKVAPPKIV